MRRLLTILFLIPTLTSLGQPGTVRLIIRVDDMGFSHSGNEAIIKCYEQGIAKSVEVLVPSPWFPEAVKLLRQHPGLDVGIHLALSSEWENIKWRPLSDGASIRDSNGYFYPMIYKNKDYPGQALTENPWKLADIEKEFRAQIDLALKLIPGVTHLSSHMGCVEMSPAIKELERKLAREYKIDIDPADYQTTWVNYSGPSQTAEEKVKSFIAAIDKLKPGNYLFLDHPGINNDELKAVFHIGYETVASDRQGVTDLLTSQAVKDAIKSRSIRLIGYKELQLK